MSGIQHPMSFLSDFFHGFSAAKIHTASMIHSLHNNDSKHDSFKKKITSQRYQYVHNRLAQAEVIVQTRPIPRNPHSSPGSNKIHRFAFGKIRSWTHQHNIPYEYAWISIIVLCNERLHRSLFCAQATSVIAHVVNDALGQTLPHAALKKKSWWMRMLGQSLPHTPAVITGFSGSFDTPRSLYNTKYPPGKIKNALSQVVFLKPLLYIIRNDNFCTFGSAYGSSCPFASIHAAGFTIQTESRLARIVLHAPNTFTVSSVQELVLEGFHRIEFAVLRLKAVAVWCISTRTRLMSRRFLFCPPTTAWSFMLFRSTWHIIRAAWKCVARFRLGLPIFIPIWPHPILGSPGIFPPFGRSIQCTLGSSTATLWRWLQPWTRACPKHRWIAWCELLPAVCLRHVVACPDAL